MHHPAQAPLVIQGAGTGGAIGSACLINDIVQIMQDEANIGS